MRFLLVSGRPLGEPVPSRRREEVVAHRGLRRAEAAADAADGAGVHARDDEAVDLVVVGPEAPLTDPGFSVEVVRHQDVNDLVDWCDVSDDAVRVEAALSAHADSGVRTVFVASISGAGAVTIDAGAQFRSSKGEWRATGTASFPGANTVTVRTGNVAGAGTTIATLPVDALGVWTMQVKGSPVPQSTTINVVVVPPNVYLKADQASWTKLAKSAVAGQLFAGKWLQTTTADPNFGSFAMLLDAAQ